MIRQDDKFVQKVHVLSSIAQEHFNKEPGNLVDLEQTLSVKDISRQCSFAIHSHSATDDRNESRATGSPPSKMLLFDDTQQSQKIERELNAFLHTKNGFEGKETS